jgi:hypothetical protein
VAARGRAGIKCDFCNAACARTERRQLIWQTEADGDFVLADICPRCASGSGRLLEAYVGRGRQSLRLAGHTGHGTATGGTVVHRASGALARAAIYVLIALATFFVVTLITARH